MFTAPPTNNPEASAQHNPEARAQNIGAAAPRAARGPGREQEPPARPRGGPAQLREG